MTTCNKSLFTSALAFAGVGLFLVGCKSEPEAGTTAATTGSTPTTAPAPNADANTATAVTFASVQPILKERCLQCHNGPKGKEGVDFTSYESVMKGGEEGPIVKAGDPTNSLIVQVIRGVEGHPKMPPTGGPLTEDQIKTIEDWIKGGATS
jgi:uncharacterized membrane protein